MNDYKRKLGEKISEAYRDETDIKPDAEDVERWLRAAEVKKKNKRRRLEVAAGVVFNVVFLVTAGTVAVLNLNDADAGAVHTAKIEEAGSYIEGTTIEIYKDRDDLPEDVKEEFIMFPERLGGFEETEIRVIEEKKQKSLKATYSDKDEQLTIIYQDKHNYEVSSKAIANNGGIKEEWDDIEVRIMDSKGRREYVFLYDDIYVRITVDGELEKEVIKEFVNEALKK